MAGKNFYHYGKFYDLALGRVPNPNSNYDIIVYLSNFGEDKAICSLEGIFVTSSKLDESEKKRTGNAFSENLMCRREQMKIFEEKHHGKFVPFGKFF
mgnify:CR=1 FL=1